MRKHLDWAAIRRGWKLYWDRKPTESLRQGFSPEAVRDGWEQYKKATKKD